MENTKIYLFLRRHSKQAVFGAISAQNGPKLASSGH
jgi:hypothetical protein